MADHAKTTTTDNTMTVERIKSVVLLIVQLYSVVQTGLTLAGISELPFTSDEVSAGITGAIAVASSIYSWWRNNNVTEAAVEGQKLTTAIKNGSLTATQGTSAAPETAAAVTSDTTTTATTTATSENVTLDTVTGTPVIEIG